MRIFEGVGGFRRALYAPPWTISFSVRAERSRSTVNAHDLGRASTALSTNGGGGWACKAVLVGSLSLVACHHQPASDATLAQVQRGTAPEARATDTRIPCATGTAPLAPACTFSREKTPAGLVVTIQRADGGFRRLLVTRDGRGVIAADGAQSARVSVVGADQIEVTLGGDRYRLPATIRSGAR